MKWTQETPTEPGWYWQRHVQDHSIDRVCQIVKTRDGLETFAWGRGGFRPVEGSDGQYMEWYGPLKQPE